MEKFCAIVGKKLADWRFPGVLHDTITICSQKLPPHLPSRWLHSPPALRLGVPQAKRRYRGRYVWRLAITGRGSTPNAPQVAFELNAVQFLSSYRTNGEKLYRPGISTLPGVAAQATRRIVQKTRAQRPGRRAREQLASRAAERTHTLNTHLQVTQKTSTQALTAPKMLKPMNVYRTHCVQVPKSVSLLERRPMTFPAEYDP